MNDFAVCVACGDTGENSKGLPCRPCQVHGRQTARQYAVMRKLGDGVAVITAGPSYNVNALRDYMPKTDTIEYIVLLGDKPKPIARWQNGRWQRKKKK